MTLLPQSTLDHLKLARFPVKRTKTGARLGNHKSVFTGASAEFAQHREYSAGDEPKRIDWRVLARTERLVIKQYDQETNLRSTLVVDTSASMGYQGGRFRKLSKPSVTKLQHAAGIAAALAWILVRQGDSVSMIGFDQKVHQRTPYASTPGHLHRLIQALGKLSPQHASQTAATLHNIASILPERGLVILFSDLFEDTEGLRQALHHLRFRNHEIVVIQILAKDELDFSLEGSIRFRDMENPVSHFEADPAAIRKEYLRQLGNHFEAIEIACDQVQADYLLTTTDQSIPDVITNLLARRCGGMLSQLPSKGDPA